MTHPSTQYLLWIDDRHRRRDWRQMQFPNSELRFGYYSLGKRETDGERQIGHRPRQCHQTLFDAIDEYVIYQALIVLAFIRRIRDDRLELLFVFCLLGTKVCPRDLRVLVELQLTDVRISL